MDAWEEVEGQLMKERVVAVKRCEDMDDQYQGQTLAAQANVDLALACLHCVDIALAGTCFFLHSYLILLFSDLAFFPTSLFSDWFFARRLAQLHSYCCTSCC